METCLDGLDDARGSIADHQEWIAETAGTHVLEEGADRLSILFRTGHQRQQDLFAIATEPPGREDRLALLSRANALRDPVDEQ